MSYETVLKSIRATTTTNGLRVRACLTEKHYQKGIKVSQDQMRRVRLKRRRANPDWYYSIAPANV